MIHFVAGFPDLPGCSWGVEDEADEKLHGVSPDPAITKGDDK